MVVLTRSTLALALLTIGSGCSLLGLFDELPEGAPIRCALDSECTRGNDCLADRCVEGFCQLMTDGDGDGHISTACAGTLVDDGMTVLDDCDDDDETVFPGAPELCDTGINDCDLWVGDPTRPEDADGDGYAGIECEAGASIEPGDCDDDDGSVHPGAVEACNSADEDCDGVMDEACARADMLVVEERRACVLRLGNVWCWDGAEASRVSGEPVDQIFGCGKTVVGVADGAVVLVDGESEDMFPTIAATSAIEEVVCTQNGVACARLADATVRCWDSMGGFPSEGMMVPGGFDASDLTWIQNPAPFACVRRTNGDLSCSGPDFMPFAPSRDCSELAGSWNELRSYEDGERVCARSGDRVRCFSARYAVMMTTADCDPGFDVTLPVPMPSGPMTVGTSHACVQLDRDGGIACWGEGGQGQLGDGLGMSQSSPVIVLGPSDLHSPAASQGFTCALSDVDIPEVHCWGALGGFSSDVPVPVPL